MSNQDIPAPGILGSEWLKSTERKSQGVFTHNPYWYPGFDPLALTGVSQNQHYSSPHVVSGFLHYAMQQRPERRDIRTLQSLKGTNLKLHLRDGDQPRLAHRNNVLSDSASEHSLGHSDSEGSQRSSGNPLEAQLVQCIVNYFGDYKGSLPSERVQNVIKKDHAALYDAVVVSTFRKKWHKFLQHNADTFQLFTRPAQPAPNQDYCWRIRLVNNLDWEEADQQDEEQRNRRDQDLLDKLRDCLLRTPDRQCPMIDVIAELNKDIKGDDGSQIDVDGEAAPSGKMRKIRAGDLKRLVRKCNSNFTIIEVPEEEGQKRATFMKLL